MKTLILLLFFPLFVSGQNMYIELNFGVAKIYDTGVFPGTSLLVGNKFELKDNLFLDTEIGLALPSIITGKIGVGRYIHKKTQTAFIVGVRPWPFHLYCQVNLPEGKRGQWILSAELGTGKVYSMESSFIANFGYQWKINRKEKKNKELIQNINKTSISSFLK